MQLYLFGDLAENDSSNSMSEVEQTIVVCPQTNTVDTCLPKKFGKDNGPTVESLDAIELS
jgi:hypothetical protein